MNKIKLSPCKCGNKKLAYLTETRHNGKHFCKTRHRIYCLECNLSTVWEFSKQKAFEGWNNNMALNSCKCGSNDVKLHYPHLTYYASCNDCGQCGKHSKSPEKAIINWNKISKDKEKKCVK